MRIKIDISQEDVKEALEAHIERRFGFEPSGYKLSIEVKSKQNYRSEWELADFRASLERFT